MSRTERRVLMVPGTAQREPELLRLMVPSLLKFGCVTERAAVGYGAAAVLEQISFSLVVVGCPIQEPPLGALIRSMRWKEAACRSTPLLVVAWPEGLWDAEDLLGRGVNRVIRHDASQWRVERTLRDLLVVEPRVRYSTLIKVQMPHGDRVESKMAQLDNLSTSGMLVRAPDHVDVGAPLPFEIPLSDDPTPIKGLAEVVRSTTRSREGVTGFAARFVQIEDDGANRLERFVQRRATKD
jgi:hypothetical protein